MISFLATLRSSWPTPSLDPPIVAQPQRGLGGEEVEAPLIAYRFSIDSIPGIPGLLGKSHFIAAVIIFFFPYL